jgi:iron complex outermembrane receptor protein
MKDWMWRKRRFGVPVRCRRAAGTTSAILLLLAGIRGSAGAEAPDSTATPVVAAADLTELTLEQLSNVPVSSVSRRSERLSDAPASVYVITAEDIRRSGAKTLPEALRLCPTLQVARADANQYAISARGFNSVLANKMLVLIDGRTVYSPLFSGVFWEAQDLMLQDVERIEVLSGPGGTSWGTNAVNGTINVITRAATETQGVLAAAGGGTDLKVGEARFGGGRSPHYRAYGKYTSQDHSELTNGTAVQDASERYQAGVRTRWQGPVNTLRLDAGGYHNEIDQLPDDREVSGYHLLGRWTHEPETGGRVRIQAYYERDRRDQPGSLRDVLDTWDAEFQHELRAARQTLVWGAGLRYQTDRVDSLSPALTFIPEDRNLTSTHVFAEDALHLTGALDLIAGLRVEHNVYTEYEWLPTARLAWRSGSGQLLWTAVSRAVRAPSRVDREFFSPASPPHFILAGGADFRSELADVAEIGYRAQPLPALSYSITGFYGAYDRLRSIEPSPAGPVFRNGLEGETHGVEGWANYRVTPFWRLSAGGLAQNRDIDVEPGVVDLGGRVTLGNDPHHQWTLRSSLDLGAHHELDLWVRQVDELAPTPVPGYTTLDARIASRILSGFELSVTGYNLLGPEHPEWGGSPANRAVFGPSVFAQVQWRP